MMIDDAYGATIAKRRLADILSCLRLDLGLTATQVCERLGWGRGKLGRFETNQWKRPEISDIRDLLRLYQIGQSEQDRIIGLALLARKRPWWREYSDVYDTEYPGFENDACEIKLFSPLTFPVLFQTRKYAELRHRHLRLTTRQSARLLETVLHRQRILLRDDATAPDVIAVITEAALRYDWGSITDQLEQVIRLTTLSSRPNIELRLHSFAAGSPPSPVGPVTYMRFRPDEAALAFVDTSLTTTLVADQQAAEIHASRLSEVFDQAYDRTRTAQYLTELIRTLSLRGDRVNHDCTI